MGGAADLSVHRWSLPAGREGSSESRTYWYGYVDSGIVYDMRTGLFPITGEAMVVQVCRESEVQVCW